MHLKVGETYNFFKNIEDWWILKVVEIVEDRYWVDVLKRVGNQQFMIGHRSWVSFNSTMFNTYQITKYHKADIDESFDPEIDELIAHVQKQFEINQLQEMIDLALKNRNETVFIELTSELNKIKGVYA